MGFDIQGTELKKYREDPGVEKVVIPDGITRIAPMAMNYQCDHIKEIVVPEGVTYIGYECFWYSKALEKVTLPESLSEVTDDVFYNCPKLHSVNIPGALEKIGSGMFGKCTSLKEIVIPEGVKEIGRAAFAGCKSLKKVVLPNSLKRIKPYAFEGCLKLQDINISDGVRIGKGAFEGCKSLDKKAEFVIVRKELCGYNGDGEKVLIPENVKNIGSSVFSYNKKIKEVYIPDSVNNIGDGAFKRCLNLKKIRLSSGISEIGTETFWDCEALEEIVIPEGIKTIRESAFRHCYSLKEIRLPYSVKTIEKKAFAGTLGSVSTDYSTVIIAPGTSIDDIYSPEDKFASAIGYIKNAEIYSPTVARSYQQYLSKRKKDILPIVWENDLAKALQAFADSGILTNKTHEEFLGEANKNKAIQCVAFLMNWKNDINKGTTKEVKKENSYLDYFEGIIRNKNSK